MRLRKAVTEAVNDTLKAIAASLLMEQVLAPRFEFTPKTPTTGPQDGFDYGDDGYDPNKCNVGIDQNSGKMQIEIKGLTPPRSKEAERICKEDLNEVITAFVQDKTAMERGLFDEELVPEEITQVSMGKIVKEKYPELDDEDQEAVRQHAIAALTLIQKAKEVVGADNHQEKGNTALIDGVRRYAMDVRELDIDLIDRINPFGEAYSILAKSMSEERLKQVAAIISAKRVNFSHDEARDLARRAVKFKQERGRLPSITSADPWEKRMAEGVAFLTRLKSEATNGLALPMKMMLYLKNSGWTSRQKRQKPGPLERIASLQGLKKSSVSIRKTSVPLKTVMIWIFSRDCMQLDLNACETWKSADHCLYHWIIKDS